MGSAWWWRGDCLCYRRPQGRPAHLLQHFPKGAAIPGSLTSISSSPSKGPMSRRRPKVPSSVPPLASRQASVGGEVAEAVGARSLSAGRHLRWRTLVGASGKGFPVDEDRIASGEHFWNYLRCPLLALVPRQVLRRWVSAETGRLDSSLGVAGRRRFSRYPSRARARGRQSRQNRANRFELAGQSPGGH